MSVVQNIVKDAEGRDVVVSIEVDEQRLNAPQGRDIYDETRKVPDRIKDAFENAMGLIHTCAERVAHTLDGIPQNVRPRACEVQFAVKIDGEVGAVLAKCSTEAQFQITMTWGSKEDK